MLPYTGSDVVLVVLVVAGVVLLVRVLAAPVRVLGFLARHPRSVAAALRAPVVPLPEDPTVLDTRVVVPAGPDEIGAEFLSPAPASEPRPESGSDGSRQEARVQLARGTHVIVVRLGAVQPVGTVEPSSVRPGLWEPQPGSRRLGPVVELDLAAGRASWHTVLMGRMLLTDVHVDHAGEGWVIGFLRPEGDESLMPVFEQVLASWRWRPALGPEHRVRVAGG